MNPSTKCLLLLIVLSLALATPFAAMGANPTAEELRGAPVFAEIAGTRVNVREGPSTTHTSLGKLDGNTWEILTVVDAAPGDDETTWYRVLSGRLGEGWVREDFLKFKPFYEPREPLLALIYSDVGVNLSTSEKRLGKPDKVKRNVIDVDWKLKNITSTQLKYPHGTVGFWDFNGGMLMDADLSGGIDGFGGVRFGMSREEVDTLLGPPETVAKESLRNYSADELWEYDSGLWYLLVCFDSESRVERLVFNYNIP
ncbi:MAG: SH3 domain-containing protein [Aminobacteriaceae bacterium]